MDDVDRDRQTDERTDKQTFKQTDSRIEEIDRPNRRLNGQIWATKYT